MISCQSVRRSRVVFNTLVPPPSVFATAVMRAIHLRDDERLYRCGSGDTEVSEELPEYDPPEVYVRGDLAGAGRTESGHASCIS